MSDIVTQISFRRRGNSNVLRIDHPHRLVFTVNLTDAEAFALLDQLADQLPVQVEPDLVIEAAHGGAERVRIAH